MERFLKSRYQIGEQIGEGPFSFTYKGDLIGTQVPVIIKIYKRSALNSPLINKLKPKVLKMVNLDYPYIAKILDGDYGWQGYYFVREYVEGIALSDLLETQSYDLNSSLEIIKRICGALRFAHENKVIHGSLGAKNVFISSRKELKVVDFLLEGKVRSNIDLLAKQTMVDSRYLSPEQIKGETVTDLSDIYSTGVLLYHLLTGTLPFNGKDNLEIAMKHLNHMPEAPSSLNPEIPSYLDEIVLKAMEKDPVMRFRKIKEIEESINEKALVYKGAEVDLTNLIYDDIDVMDFDDDKKDELKIKKDKPIKKKQNLLLWVFFIILVAIASGLWYSFIQDFIKVR